MKKYMSFLVSLLSVKFLEVKKTTAKKLEDCYHSLISVSMFSSFQLKGGLLQGSRMSKSTLN